MVLQAPYNRSVTDNAEVEPRILPRSEHPISRRDIDKNALKVLYRLNSSGYLAFILGGSVRDLMVGVVLSVSSWYFFYVVLDVPLTPGILDGIL